MDILEKIGYTCLGVIAVSYIAALLYGLLSLFPYGLPGLIGITGIGALLIKVLKERLANKEDDYYSKTWRNKNHAHDHAGRICRL